MFNVNTINGCAGDVEISQMWEKHYENLYNSVNVAADKNTFLQRLSQSNKGSDRYSWLVCLFLFCALVFILNSCSLQVATSDNLVLKYCAKHLLFY